MLIDKLKKENWLWSYDVSKIDQNTFPDELVIEKTLTHLDIADMDLLFYYYKPEYVKKVWRERMAIQGDYLRTINRFLAWYYFKIKQPDRYLKSAETLFLKKYM